MSEAEDIDIGAAQLTGINESVSCANVQDKPSGEEYWVNPESIQNVPMFCESSGEIRSVYPDTVQNEGASIMNWDVGVGYELGMLGEEINACDSGGMGIRISNGQQQGDGVSLANVVMDGGESRTYEPAEDCSKTSSCRKSLSPGEIVGAQSHMDSIESCGLAKDDVKALNCINDETLGDALSPGNCENQSFRDITFMPTAGEQHTLCHDGQTCELLTLGNSICLDSVKGGLSESNIVLPNLVVREQASESVIPREIAIELPCQLNLQNGLANCGTEFCGHVLLGEFGQRLSPNQIREDEQDGFGGQSFHNEPLEDKDHIEQLENDSNPKEDNVKDSCKNNHGSVDDLLNKPVQTSNLVSGCNSSEKAANFARFEQASENIWEGVHGNINNEQLEEKEKASFEAEQGDRKQDRKAESSFEVIEPSPVDGGPISLDKQVEKSLYDVSKNSGKIKQNLPLSSEQFGPPPEETTEKVLVVVLASPANYANENSSRGRKPGKTPAVLRKEKYPLQSSIGTRKFLRSTSRENRRAAEPSINMEKTSSSTGRGRGRPKKKVVEGQSNDEFSRTRKHLRYLLHRINYERNLLDAYSSEGWRGQSIEKLRPEKELQRAKADINRSKMKIRDLFQRLGSMSSEGKFPESLYDSDGLIDSEDIFCAKCGSKELSAGNDIILCDGACERGFHQLCLEPPLRTEEIPPGDEGWLCPACDCKADCIDLLNDSQGTKISIEDSWEKVFPEAVAWMDGGAQDDMMGLPSDDSEDNDFNPDGMDDDVDDDAKVEGSEASSDESDSSDFSSVSEDLGAIHGPEQQLHGLPSDDSEDDDYNPDAPNVDIEVEHESSTSDFTSASEDLGATVDGGRTSDKDELPVPLVEADQDLGDYPPLSGRRHVERLDYKKLYDETYGNASSDSSDDEEWMDIIAMRKRKSSGERGRSVCSHGDASADVTTSGTRRRGRPKKLNLQPTKGSPSQLEKSTEKSSTSGKSTTPHKRLGEIATQRLYESFKENQYPDRLTKEKLAMELGLTPEKVNKWFGNARWSFNHHPSRVESSIARVASRSNIPHDVASSGAQSSTPNADTSVLDPKESGRRKSTPQKTGKRNNKEDDQPIHEPLNTETSKEVTQPGLLQTPESERGRKQRKRRKSGA